TTIRATMDGVYIARLVATGTTETVAYDDIVFTWDTHAPVIHANIIQEAVGPNGNVVTFVPASDALDANLTVICNHASGETFPVGVTIVNVTATDAAGNSISGSFTITIR